jgi:hypothetical protein
MEVEWINCGGCMTRTNAIDFDVKKGIRYKTCNRCREKAKANYEAKKCEHGRSKPQCIDCGGSAICEHRCRKSKCKKCGGSEICTHQKRRANCVDCGGSEICEHKRQRAYCKQCTDPQKVLIENWIKHSNQCDKLRKQETNITREFCAKIIAESGNCCCYCAVELQMLERTPNMMTIERIDNRLGHIIGNCRIACFYCNAARVGGK